MSDVRAVVRAFKLYEAFAAHGRPMTLSELAEYIDAPPSSCLLVIRTLLSVGHIYSVGRHQTYYPTRLMFDLTNTIAKHDPIVERVQPYLERFRDSCGETVALAKMQGDMFVYLAVAESKLAIHAVTTPGKQRPLHSTATGKALLSALSAEERAAVIGKLELTRYTERTIVTAEELETELQIGTVRGYFTTFGETVPDLTSISAPVQINGDSYALSLMGPSYRLDGQMRIHGPRLQDFASELSGGMASVAIPGFDTPAEPVAAPAKAGRASKPAKRLVKQAK